MAAALSALARAGLTIEPLARLLTLRSELLDARLGHGRWVADLAGCR